MKKKAKQPPHSNPLAKLLRNEDVDLNLLTFTIYIIVIANFLLGLAVAGSSLHFNISEQQKSLIFMSYFFLFYVLLLIFTLRYVNALRSIYLKNEGKFLSIAFIIGLFVAGYFSNKYLGMAATLNWFAPTLATLIVAYILNKIKKQE